MNHDKNKGLADNNDGEFILNESGTSVSIDAEGEFTEDQAIAEADKQVNENFVKKPENQEKKD